MRISNTPEGGVGPSLRNALTWLASLEQEYDIVAYGPDHQSSETTTLSALLAQPANAAWLDGGTWTEISYTPEYQAIPQSIYDPSYDPNVPLSKRRLGIDGAIDGVFPDGTLLRITFGGYIRS